MNSAVVGPVVAAVLVLVGVIFTQRQLAQAAARTAGLEQTKVDGAAYDRAREFDREIVTGLRLEVERLRQDIRQLNATLQRERDDRSTERMKEREDRSVERTELRSLIAELRQTVARQGRELGETS